MASCDLRVSRQDIAEAEAALSAKQQLNKQTWAVHAAALLELDRALIRPTRRRITTSLFDDLHGDFDVRERLGDPRVVPRFICSILPSMSSSTSPGSRLLHTSSSFTRRACFHREPNGSALPTLSDFGAY
jgi:hypothetical protein